MKSITVLMMVAFSCLALTTFSQEKAGKKDTAQHTILYACPMHSNITSTKPGTCSICGMKLEKSGKESMKKEVTKNYSCPVHTEELSEKPGKCPQCGKDLILSPKEKTKMGVMKKYTCSMHPDITSDKPGNCSKCGMELLEKKEDSSEHNHKSF